MTMEERNTILEAADILKALGGNNGFANIQPKLKATLRSYAGKLDKIARDDIQAEFERKGAAAIAPGATMTKPPFAIKSRDDLDLTVDSGWAAAMDTQSRD